MGYLHVRGLHPLVVGTLALMAACGGTGPPLQPDVLLITLDTTRADHLGAYGYEHETSPNLDQLAAHSIVYDHARSTSSWTLPAHASLFTGLFPTSHGARKDPTGPLRLRAAIEGPEDWDVYRARGLGADVRTLAEIVRDAGYSTGAVVAGPWMKRVFGLDRGFEFYDDEGIESASGRDGARVTDAALARIDACARPCFLFLNYFDPHYPYDPPPELAGRFGAAALREQGHEPTRDEMAGLYDAEILYMDAQLGRLLHELKERRRYDETLIVVTADHGELLGENGRFRHGKTLFEAELRVPLIVKPAGPRQGVERVTEPIQLTDVFELVLDRLGLSAAPAGRAAPSIGSEIVSFAEVYPLPAVTDQGDSRALIVGRWKYVWNSNGRHALFDLEQDPGEESNLYAARPEEARRLATELDAFARGLPRPTLEEFQTTIDGETREALEKLGYLD